MDSCIHDTKPLYIGNLRTNSVRSVGKMANTNGNATHGTSASTQLVHCLKKPAESRTNEDVEIIFYHLRSMHAMSGLLESSIRVMCLSARYEHHESNSLLYEDFHSASCWYILLSGCVFLEGCMFLPGSSFGKQPFGFDHKRGTDCLILEHSEMIVIDYPDNNLLQPFQRHSYCKNELEKLLALEADEYHIGGQIPEDEQLPMELRDVKEILLRGEMIVKQSTINALSACVTMQSRSTEHLELDLTGLVESIVDSDDEDEEALHSSQESLMVRDVVRDYLEKDPSDRTESDIQALLDFMQHLPAFANMMMNVRRALCAVMVFAVVEKAGSIVMENGEELDSWCVILNGSVEVIGDGEDVTLHLGDSFGVKPTLKKMHHKGTMRTRVDDCQFVCIAQAEYYRILTQGERNIQCIEEGGEVVMVTEHRTTDGGNRQGHVVIKATPEKLIRHLVEDHSVIDPTYVEDFLLTYKTFRDQPTEICGNLLSWFLDRPYRDKVTRVMLLWVNNHYGDFEGNLFMEDYLETFERGLEQQQMGGQLGLLNIACDTKAKTRVISLDRPSRETSLGFTIAGGKESGFGIYVSKVDSECLAHYNGLRKGDQILQVNGQSFENIQYVKAREILSLVIRVSLTVKRNSAGFKEMLAYPNDKESLKYTQAKDSVQRSSSDCSERQRNLHSRLSVPDITSGTFGRKGTPAHYSTTATEKVKRALNRISALGTLSRSSKLISRSERDLASVDSGFHETSDEVHAYAKLSIKPRSRATLPRAFGSSECISTTDQTIEYPDKVIKVFKADQTCKYFMIYKETTARELVNMAVEGFGIQDYPGNYSLCQVTVEDGGLIKQKRLPDSLCNLSEKIHLNGRYYLKNNLETGSLLQDEAAQQELTKESQYTLLQLKSQEVARELTLQDFEIFRAIDPREYIYDLWDFGLKFSENLKLFADIVNKEMFWVVTEICSEVNVVKRMKLIKHFIKMARHCKECRNYNSLFAIISGLSHSAVRRLKNTWDKVPTRHNKTYEDLQNLMDPSRNMSKYRNLVSDAHSEPPLIPFFPVIKKDLTFIHLGNDSVIEGLVNFEKLRLIAREVRQISKFSAVPYDSSTMFERDSSTGSGNLHSKASVATWSRRSLRDQNPKKMYEEAMMTRRVKQYLSDLHVETDEDQLIEMSCVCEPPQGSAPPSVQTRRKNSPNSSPSLSKKDKKFGNKLAVSPLVSRKLHSSGDRTSISSTTSTASLPEGSSVKHVQEERDDVFIESDTTSLKEERLQDTDSRIYRAHHQVDPDVVRPFEYSDSAESHPPSPYSSVHSASPQENSFHTGISTYNTYSSYPYHEPYRVEYVPQFDDDEEGQVSQV